MKRALALLLTGTLALTMIPMNVAATEVATEAATETVISTETVIGTETVSDTEIVDDTEAILDTEEVATTETEEVTTETETETVKQPVETEEVAEPESGMDVESTGAGTTIRVSVKAGADIVETVNDALNLARENATASNPYTVTIPAGSYKLSAQLRIYSNTTLNATGATLTYSNKNDNHNMLQMGDSSINASSQAKGYGGFENITIIGGTWNSIASNTSSIMRMAHAKNVKVDGVTISGGGCAHQMEVCAISGFTVTNTTFQNLASKSTAEESDKQEALQLDIPCAEDIFPGTYQDGTPMENVTITGCTFQNVPRGVGTHSMLMGAYHKNIIISGNKFKDIKEEAIIGLNYYNCEITNNSITNCGGGVLFQYFKSNTESIHMTAEDINYKGAANFIHDAKTVITGNTITTKYDVTCDEVQGIKVYGGKLTKKAKSGDNKYIPVGDYYITGVTVSGNTITTAGHGIHLSATKNCSVSKNTITGSGVSSKDALRDSYDGIFLSAASTGNSITNNKISGMVRNGIFLMDGSSAKKISGNTIKKAGKYGIDLYNKSKVSGDITKNKITTTGNTAIFLSTSSTAKNIISNTIAKSKGWGIGVWYKSKVTGSITSNTITDTSNKGFGICVQKSSTVTGDIQSNKILKSANKNSSSKGIMINDKSLVTGKIQKNTINNTVENGISVTNGSTSGHLYANTISKAGNSAILINKSTVKGKIASNTITDTATRGNVIHITAKSTVTSSVEKNVITKRKNKYSGGSGIFVYNSSQVKGAIGKNKISNTRGVGIYINLSSKVKGDISGNTVTKPGQKGIYVYNKSTVKSMLNNTINGAVSQGINLASIKNDVIISGNTIKNGKENGILIQPKTTSYKITLSKNTILVKSNRYAIHATSGKVAGNRNTVTKKSMQIKLDNGVKGKITKTKYK